MAGGGGSSMGSIGRALLGSSAKELVLAPRAMVRARGRVRSTAEEQVLASSSSPNPLALTLALAPIL
jgi:hypothetical protein